MRKTLPIVVAVLAGFLILADYFIPNPQLDALGAALVEGATILAAFGLLLGLLNLLNVHARRVADPQVRGRSYSLVLLIGLLATLAIGVILPASPTMAWVFNYLYDPLQSTMTALLAFFVISAAYHTFKLRQRGAWVLLVTSLIVLLLQLPFSAKISLYLPFIREWILAVPVTAGMRGIILGVVLGTITTSLRLLLAVDRPYVQE